MKTLWNPSTISILFLYFLLKQENRAGCIIIKKKNLVSQQWTWLAKCEWWIYIALYRALLYTQSTLQSRVCVCGGGGSSQPPPLCSILLDDETAATVQRRQCAHHTAAFVREMEPIKWMGLLGGHDWQGPVEGIWPGHRGYTPTLYEKCHGIFFYYHRKSGPRFNVSSVGQCFLQYRVPVTIMVR